MRITFGALFLGFFFCLLCQAKSRQAIDADAVDEETLVQEATEILQAQKSVSSRLSTYTKPKGVLAKAAYVAQELFTVLFFNAPTQTEGVTSQPRAKSISTDLLYAVKLLEGAVYHHDSHDAKWLLAEMNFHGNFTYPRNYTTAFQYYSDLAPSGNASAQYMTGFMFATGIGGAVKQDQAKALLYHSFAAEGGNIRSQMTLAYRHHAGIGTPRNCEKAVQYYRQVADEAVRYYKSGPPGGHVLIRNAYRLADEDGGVYGEGASVSSAGPNAKQGGPTSDAYADLDDVIEYLDVESRKGDLRATLHLGRLYYDGARGLERDMRLAKSYFMQIARLYWTSSGKVKKDFSPTVEKLAPRAAGLLGRMFMRGEGMEQSYAKAKIWFTRGLASGDALSQYSMGLMYLYGLGVPKDAVKAAEYFSPAADAELAVAQTNLGILFLDQGDVQTAKQYFELSMRNGHIEAYFYLAEIANQGIGRDRSCGMAAVYYKIAAEKAEIIHSPFIEANEAYERGDMETSLIAYMMAAEQGYENAQANVGFILDATKPRYSVQTLLSTFKKTSTTISTAFGDAALALIYWTRSAKQSNIDSLVKMGDYYLDGIGASASSEHAAACYQAAAETMHSAQAMWNLGWMHENGVGIQQDFHLAKRFYDQALETNKEAYLPVQLSLMKLRLRSWWNGVSGGSINSIRDEPGEYRQSIHSGDL